MSGFGKPSDGYRVHKRSLEPTTMALGVDRTPVERFFVCNVDDAPVLDPASWSMTVGGDAASGSATLGLAELAALPQHDVDAWLECAGNGRTLFERVDGHVPSGAEADTQWTLGAMAMAAWRGPRLADVLDLVDRSSDAAWVSPVGLDISNAEGEAPRMCLPLDKARDPDTLIALEMNDSPLVAAHGAPARLLVPGWIGAYSVKWLDRIDVAAEWVPSWRGDVYYRRRDPDGTDRGPATVHPVKSSVALEWDAELAAGEHELMGYARSGGHTVATVDWSLDHGDWERAELVGPNGRWTWAPFRFTVDLAAGSHVIRTRATDAAGQTQPASNAYNPSTILWNAITPHPVRVR